MHETSHAHLHFDSPAAPGPVSAGPLMVRGWLVGKPGWHFTDVRIRLGTTVFPGIHGHPRRDLAQHFGAAAPYLLAGFEVSVTLPAGRHTLQFEACDIRGEWLSVDRLEVEATGTAAPLPDVAPPTLRTHEFAQALRVLLRRLATGGAADEQAAAVVADTPRHRDARYAHQPFHAHANQPAAWDRAIFGRLPVAGWMFHESSPIRRVLATTDLQSVQELTAGAATPAIAARFPSIAAAANCGFEGFIDLPAQLPAPACIRFYAELPDGSWHLGPVVRATVTDHEFEKQPYANFSAWRFWQTWRALRRAFVAAGFTLPPAGELRAEFLPLYREYRQRAPRRAAAPAPIASLPAHPAGRIHLITHNLNLEGAPLFLLEYARHLVREQGLAIAVTSAREGPLRREFEALGAAVQVVDTSALLRAPDAATLARNLADLARQVDLSGASLVVANTLSSFWGVHLAHWTGRRSLLYIHESTTPASFYLGHLASAALPVVEETFRLATRVSFLTVTTQRYYNALSTGSNYCLNPGWIDLSAIDRFRAGQSRAALRRRLGIPDQTRLVVNVGSVCDRKGQMIFARAVDLLWRSDAALAANTQFLMIGGRDTPFDEAVAGLLGDLHRPDLRVVPETADAYSWYGAADLFVCSSYEESFPRVVLEAMAFSLPIIASSVHGIPEIARSEQEAVLVPPGDTAALAHALVRLLRTPETGATLAARARTRVATEFDRTVIQPRHVALARKLINDSL